MRSNLFESELERLARTLTDQFGVQVVCQGDEAWTDGKQIVLPSLPDPMDEPLERMVVGYLDHEMAHVAFSDFKVVKEFSEKHPGYEALLNVVEDGLIERRAMQRWPGVRANLNAMFAQVRDRIIALVAQRDALGRFCTAVYLKLAHYGDLLGLDAEVSGYEDLLDQFPAVRKTSDSAVLAERLLDRWIQNHPVQSAAPNSQAGDGSESQNGDRPSNAADQSRSPDAPLPDSSNAAPKQSDERSDGNEPPDPRAAENVGQAASSDASALRSTGSDSSPGSRGTDEDGKPDAGQEAKPSVENSGSGPDGNKPTAIPNQSGPASDPEGEQLATPVVAAPRGAGGTSLITQALAEAIAEHAAQFHTGGEYRVYTKRFDRVEVLPCAGDSDVAEMLAKHADIVRRLRRGLANALRSAEKRWWRDAQLRGALSPRGLHRLCLERPQLDVFRTRASVQGQSTAVSLVLDASGSMTSNKMDVARDALRVLLQALDELQVASEAITFTTGNDANIFKQAALLGANPNDLRQRYSRIANLEIGFIKQFAEPVKTALKRLPGIRGTGLTPLGEGMMIAARRMVSRRETRRILVVLTDGRAGCESSDGAAVQHAEHVAHRIQQAGIELVGIGILDDSLRAIVAETIVVHQLEELPAQLCKLLGRTLKKGLRYVG